MRALQRSLPALLSLALLVAVLPATASAQATPEAQCTATLEPGAIPAGEAAVNLFAVLSEGLGEITTFTGPEDSNLRLSEPDEIPRVNMANPDEEPRPIRMTAEENRISLWLNTAEVTPGTYQIHVGTEERACTAELTVSG